jgi:hypothetical protein
VPDDLSQIEDAQEQVCTLACENVPGATAARRIGVAYHVCRVDRNES